VRASRYGVFADAQTVQEFHSVPINFLENDMLPNSFVGALTPGSVSAAITLKPVAGELSFTGTGADSRILYAHTGKEPLTNGIDSCKYEFTFTDPDRSESVTDEAVIYIYVLESSTGGFSACSSSTPTISLADKPAGAVEFTWFDGSESSVMIHENSLTHTMAGSFLADSVYYIEPAITTVEPFNHIDFPKGRLTVRATATTGLMRWTGLANSNWKNPGNWVEVKGTYEAPVAFAPAGCMDVIIPSGAPSYPQLWTESSCRDITMEDCAMIAPIHLLTYNNARVEFKLTPSERDRFVMWSAPLKSMYSGDYHFKDAASNPKWGDVYMNLFQHANPDGTSSVAAIKSFTATFGNLDKALSLGTAFNLKVTSTSANKDKSFVFPQTAGSYDANDNTYYTPRANGGKFIVDRTAGNLIMLPVINDVSGSDLIQIVNPYMAYLSISDVLSANNTLSNAGYAIWNGDISSFAQIGTAGDNDNRFGITTVPLSVSPGLIPPLQSFFVQKASGTDLINNVAMSAAWTTTTSDSPYKLRSDAGAKETNALRIKAVQDKSVSYAVLHYNLSST
jgi:hypothetical protein